MRNLSDNDRIVITGVGLTAPNANGLLSFRNALLEGKSGLRHTELRHVGRVVAGICDFNEHEYQSKKSRRRGTRAGSIAIYCANEAVKDAKLDWGNVDKSRVGVYLGITEHGNVETEEEIHQLYQNNMDTATWSPHHNPRTVSNSPAGEVTLNMQITGPHYTIGSACAGGNMGPIHAAQMLRLGEVDMALAGGVSESAATFGIFAAFASQGALGFDENPALAIRPLDQHRLGTVVSEGGCVYVMERLSDAKKRGATIYAEIAGYAVNSDATDYVLPNPERQAECLKLALKKANMLPGDIDLVNMHATGTQAGDTCEVAALREVFVNAPKTHFNCTKALIGHCMGAAGALELAGNLPSFEDGMIHPCHNIENLDNECELPNLVIAKPKTSKVSTILNTSFGMLGINSVLIVKRV